jgi:hypothetical protein
MVTHSSVNNVKQETCYVTHPLCALGGRGEQLTGPCSMSPVPEKPCSAQDQRPICCFCVAAIKLAEAASLAAPAKAAHENAQKADSDGSAISAGIRVFVCDTCVVYAAVALP